MNLEDRENLPVLFKESKFDVVCNLGAQAGVRYSIENPQPLGAFIKAIETSYGKEAKKEYLPMQAGDVSQTWADISEMEKLGYKSTTGIDKGVAQFIKWFKSYSL